MQHGRAELDEAITVLGRAGRLLDSVRLHLWDERGLTLPQLRILFRVREQPGVGVRELAEAFGVSTSNISQQLDKLVTRGLVTRVDRRTDRRQVANTLTDEGAALVGEVTQTGRAYLERLLACLTPAEQAQLTALLQRVLAAAEANPGGRIGSAPT